MRAEIQYNNTEARDKAFKFVNNDSSWSCDLSVTQYERNGSFFVGHNFYADSLEDYRNSVKNIDCVFAGIGLVFKDYSIIVADR